MPPAPAVLHHQSALQNLWNLWKWECGHAGDVSNLSVVQSLFPSFQRSAAIRRTLWSQLNLAWHPGVQSGTSEKACMSAASKSKANRNTCIHKWKTTSFKTSEFNMYAYSMDLLGSRVSMCVRDRQRKTNKKKIENWRYFSTATSGNEQVL